MLCGNIEELEASVMKLDSKTAVTDKLRWLDWMMRYLR